jgi:hypothetical protein
LADELLGLLKARVLSGIINASYGLAKNGKVDLDGTQKVRHQAVTKIYSNVKLMAMMFTYQLAMRNKTF